MPKYAAFLRGIGPGNPNMSGASLRGVCENLGFTNVQSLLASGNLIFEYAGRDSRKIEVQLEKAWPEQLGFNSMTVVKSQSEINSLIDLDPFKGLTHGASSYLMVTFMKNPSRPQFDFPYKPAGKPYVITGYADGAVFSVTDNTVVKTTDLMSWLEKSFGKDITSRTWNTVRRIHSKLLD